MLRGDYNYGMTRFYTRNGDDGYTGLLGEGRYPKSDDRLEAVGAVDEAGAALGVARATSRSPRTAEILLAAQRDLYLMMAEVAATPENAARFRQIDPARVSWLEEQADAISEVVAIPREFIIPGDTPSGAVLDLARTVVRRAERRVTRLALDGVLENREILRYLNRLSSLCFVLELFENTLAGKDSPTLAK